MIKAFNMTLEELDTEIERMYKAWNVLAPGVTPKEHGRLGDLWKAFDMKIGLAE